MTNELCAKCGHPRAEHSINGACYGICGDFTTALSSAGRLVGEGMFDPQTRGTNVGSLPPLTAAQGGSISVTRVALAVAPHPAHDATDWKAKCEAPKGCSCHPSEAPVPCQRQYALTHCLLSAAQAENKQLRAALDAAAMYARARSECYGSSPMGTYAEGHKDASSILLTQIEALIATLSPPLSPEKP